MAELKTKITDVPIKDFLDTVTDEQVRQDCWKIAELMEAATQSKGRMWGTSIVGFGSYHYKSISGQEGDWPRIGFSPRKQNLTLYLMGGFENSSELLSKLGKHKTSKGCLYIKRLSDVQIPVLVQLIDATMQYMNKTYPPN